MSSDKMGSTEGCDYRVELRTASGLIMLTMMLSCVSFSQRRETTFGQRVEISLPEKALAFTLVRRQRTEGDEIAFLLERSNEVRFYVADPGGTLNPLRSRSLQLEAGGTAPCQLSPINQQSMAVFFPRDATVTILHQDSEEQVTLFVPGDVQKMSVADLNSDGRKDLLFYGKTCSGVTMFSGQSGMTFSSGVTLFQDVSISDLAASDLNGDRITDVFLADWLGNRVVLFHGIGRGVFSEQVAFDLPGEPASLALSQQSLKRTARLAVGIPEAQQIWVFEVDATGEFRREAVLPCDENPGRIELADLNGDGLSEVIAGINHGLIVFQQSPGSVVVDRTVFAAGSEIGDWRLMDVAGNGSKDAVLLDKNDKRVVLLLNSLRRTPIPGPLTYATGIRPQGLAVGDFNGDLLNDIAVTNSSFPSLSVFLNRGKGMMDGQRSFPLAEGPGPVWPIAPDTGERGFVVSHRQTGQLSVLSFNENVSPSFIIPTGPDPYLTFSKNWRTPGQLSFLVRSTNTKEHAVSLSLFEPLNAGQFVETTISPSNPHKITALSVADFDRDGSDEIAFAAFDVERRKTSIYVAETVKGFSFGTPRQLFSFSDSVGTARVLLTGFLDEDLNPDLLLPLAPPSNVLLIAYGHDQTTLSDSLVWIHDIAAANEETFVVGDVNLDGGTDLCFVDSISRTVMALFGKRGGGFHKRKVICPAQGVTAIRTGSLTDTGMPDLVLCNGEKGTVSILFHPFDE